MATKKKSGPKVGKRKAGGKVGDLPATRGRSGAIKGGILTSGLQAASTRLGAPPDPEKLKLGQLRNPS